MHWPHKTIAFLVAVVTVLTVITACSTQKNTAQSRWWHSFNAKYNTYYNGSVAYIDGSLEKEQGNKDNYTELIPLYTVGNKGSREIGKGNFDRAIEKCEKAIKLHSIKRRPVWDKRRRKNERDIEWLSRKEYNPFLWKAWLLMGRAQFHSGAFEDAASTFAYMSRLYQSQPAIYGRARAWLAKSYIEQDWMYDAEDVIRNMQRDSIHWRAQKEWDYTYADYYIHTHEYDKAIPYLRQVIKHEMRRKQKAREWFLLGQLYRAVGNNTEAYKAYRKVARLAPPYELDFNARIAMTEVMAATQSKKMISQLRRMAASDNNKDYLDQVYYAIGNIYLSERDTTQAIAAYEQGNKKATRSGIEKGVLLLKLGDLYWDKKKFSDAGRCYGEAIGLLDKERDDYEELSRRSKILDELAPYTDAVHLQDSLQLLAKMSEKDRNAAIDRVIEALKKQEKEAKRAEQENRARLGGNTGVVNQTIQTQQRTGVQRDGQWYFYSPTAVQQGIQAFQKQWGKRENIDNWQRNNQTVLGQFDAGQPLTQAQQDSIRREEARQDSINQLTDSAQNDPHKREYYLAQIPFTEEQVQQSNAILEDALFHSGVIFKDKLDNLPLSEKALRRLSDNYPDYENMDEAYYHLFLLYSRMGLPAIADQYLQRMKQSYPRSQWTTVLSDPYFKENALLRTHLEDSIYAATYNAFKADRYGEVSTNVRLSAERFPLGANRDKFLFIGGLSHLNAGDANACLANMKTLVEKFPQSKLAEMAGMIVKGVQQGRKLHGGKFDLGNVWARRNIVLSDSDSTAVKAFSADRNANFVFIIAYKADSVDANKLLFQLARYNFTSYLVRNFDISIDEVNGLRHMTVSGFRNYDEVLQYVRQLFRQSTITSLLGKSRTILISEPNLPLLGTHFSYDDYDAFYAKHFAPLKISTFHLLTEPAEIETRRRSNNEPTQEEIDRLLDDGTFIDNGLEGEPDYQQGTTIEPEPTIPVQEEGTVIIPETAPEKTETGTTVIPEAPEKTENTGTTIIPDSPQPGTPAQKATTKTAELTPSTVIPIEETTTDSRRTTVIPTEEAAPEKQPTILIPTEEPARPTAKSDSAAATKPATATPKPVTPTPKPITPTAKPTVPTTKPAVPATPKTTPVTPTTPAAPKKEQKNNEPIIYFDNDKPQSPAKKATDKKSNDDKKDDSKKKNYDLEDEYYDFEGF